MLQTQRQIEYIPIFHWLNKKKQKKRKFLVYNNSIWLARLSDNLHKIFLKISNCFPQAVSSLFIIGKQQLNHTPVLLENYCKCIEDKSSEKTLF